MNYMENDSSFQSITKSPSRSFIEPQITFDKAINSNTKLDFNTKLDESKELYNDIKQESQNNTQNLNNPAKVMVKNTFITISSINPPQNVRNRTVSSDAILFESNFQKGSIEFSMYNQIKEPLSRLYKYPIYPKEDELQTHLEQIYKEGKPTKLIHKKQPSTNFISNLRNFPINLEKNKENIPPSIYSNKSLTHSNNLSNSNLNISQNSSPVETNSNNSTSNKSLIDFDNSQIEVNSLASNFLSHHSGNNNISTNHDIYEINSTFYTDSQSTEHDKSLLIDNENLKLKKDKISRNINLRVANPGRLAREYAYKEINFSDLPDCNKGYTTLMLRNIPNKYTQSMLLEVIEQDFQKLYDFFYLPIDFRNNCNVGYAFINLVHPYFAELFWQKFDKFKLSAFKSNKVCAVTWGRVQGLKANIEHYRNSAVMTLSSPQFKPILFHNGEKIPFPSSNRPLPEVKLRGKK